MGAKEGRPTLPEKEDGERYALSLHDPDVSLVEAAFGRSYVASFPDLGDACVCCDAATNGRRQTLDIGGGEHRGAGLLTPVCQACEAHALLSSGSAVAIGALLLIGAVVVIAGLAQGRWAIAAIGALLLAAGAALAARALGKEKQRIAGHHPGFSVYLAAKGRMMVSTRNRRVAQLILDACAERVRAIN